MFGNAYPGKTVLVTGHSGFKGSWLSLWLSELGAHVHGFSQPAPTRPNLHDMIRPMLRSEVIADLRDPGALRAMLDAVRPDLIFHLAAQPLVRFSYDQPEETWDANVMGSIRLFEAVRQLELPAPLVVVTSDKCYENREQSAGYRESDHLGGHDPYSSSKAAVEIAASSWHRSFFADNPRLGRIATARAGNVIGGGDYSADRLVPDCVRALGMNQPVVLRNPSFTRPWQHVLDCLSGYLRLGECLLTEPKSTDLAGAYNFGPADSSIRTVHELVEAFFLHWPGRMELQGPVKAPHEAGKLQLNIEKAARRLGWQPTWGFEEAVSQTAVWYRTAFTDGGDMLEFSRHQVARFSTEAAKRGCTWAVESGRKSA